jgi:hypothetical protein
MEDCLQDVGVDEIILLKEILNKELIWLRIGISLRFRVNIMIFRVIKFGGISYVAEQLRASQEGLCCVEFVTCCRIALFADLRHDC